MFIASYNTYIHHTPKTSALEHSSKQKSTSQEKPFTSFLEDKKVSQNSSQFSTYASKNNTFFHAKLLHQETYGGSTYLQEKKQHDAKERYSEAPTFSLHAKKTQKVLGGSPLQTEPNELGKLQEKYLYKEMVDTYRQNDRYYQRSA